MSDFYINTNTAWKMVKQLDFHPNCFTGFPDEYGHTIYGVNFQLHTIYRMTRQQHLMPNLCLTYAQICQLLVTPVEAHPTLIESFKATT